MNKTILLIETDQLLRSNFSDLLELEGFNVLTSDDGWLGLILAKVVRPDLIICETNIPSLDGYELLQILRDRLKTAKTPFIFLTSQSQENGYARAKELGANDYLTKPVESRELLAAINQQLRMLPLT
ncbi:response regulator [Moorena producens JHB]|uniref:Response regulator n=1 Tax=Moorena producens (strain JHB) TaxID=1454205 RepID=A0A1D9FT98_MOOP1|nr:response regulator [Moorena producens]AOY78513.2 response regulator [Moorena producens JHB]